MNQESIKYRILATDALIILSSTLFAYLLRFGVGTEGDSLTGQIQLVGTLIPIFWILVLIFLGAYDRRNLFLGLVEYTRVALSAVIVLAVVSTVSFLFKYDTSRAYVLIALPLGTIGLVVSRYLWRQYFLRQRIVGKGLASTIIVGSVQECVELRTAMQLRPWAGYRVVAEVERPGNDALLIEWLDQMDELLHSTRASAIALAGSSASDSVFVRDLSWHIEGEGVDLLVGAGTGSTFGPRVTLRFASGLPLLHLDEVALRNAQRVAKRALDLSGSALGLILLSPIFLLVSCGILVTSGTPVFFRQSRAGRDGEIFRIWKFRTMLKDAGQHREALRLASLTSGPIFKADDDPRTTRFGRFLRRWSIDELPQLLNVLGGSMSLVGPRPHPLDDVERYGDRDLRRLIAKPGMTGLWQVAGRSDLSWAASIELDLIYLENWTFVGDLAILLRTLKAVLQGAGAR